MLNFYLFIFSTVFSSHLSPKSTRWSTNVTIWNQATPSTMFKYFQNQIKLINLFSQCKRTVDILPASPEKLFPRKVTKSVDAALWIVNKQSHITQLLPALESQFTQWSWNLSLLMCALPICGNVQICSWRVLYRNIMPGREKLYDPSGSFHRIKNLLVSILIVHWN